MKRRGSRRSNFSRDFASARLECSEDVANFCVDMLEAALFTYTVHQDNANPLGYSLDMLQWTGRAHLQPWLLRLGRLLERSIRLGGRRLCPAGNLCYQGTCAMPQ